jgi:hypothetical protein
MTLAELVNTLDALDWGDILSLRLPWTPESEVKLWLESDGVQRSARDMSGDGFEYFLDVGTAIEVLRNFVERPGALDERAHLLIYYATHDGFPDWFYERSGG